jgi:hypothetical protein
MKRRVHLHRSNAEETFCGIDMEEHGDRTEFSFVRHRVTCKKCLAESKPGPLPEKDHAATELARLFRQNGLKNGVKVKLTPPQRMIVRRILKLEPVSITRLALETDHHVSTMQEVITGLLFAGVVRVISKGVVVETEE